MTWRSERQKGLTLLEATLALAIAGAGMVALLASMATGSRAAARATDLRAHVALARARLSEFETSAPGQHHGAEPDGTQWQVTITEAETSPRLALHRIHVTVTAPRQPPLTLTTERLAPP